LGPFFRTQGGGPLPTTQPVQENTSHQAEPNTRQQQTTATENNDNAAQKVIIFPFFSKKRMEHTHTKHTLQIPPRATSFPPKLATNMRMKKIFQDMLRTGITLQDIYTFADTCQSDLHH